MTNNSTRSRIPIAALLVTVMLGIGFVTATFAETVYIWRDENGVKQYADTCPPERKRCRSREIGSMTERRQAKWRERVETSTAERTTTDTNTSTSGGTTSGDAGDVGTTVEAGAPDDTTAMTDDAAAEPTPGNNDGESDSADNTPAEPVDHTATVEWDPVDHSALSGYRVYHAVAGGPYPVVGEGINAGRSTSFTISSLDSGTRYYFKVTSVDAAGNESAFSNEVYKDIP